MEVRETKKVIKELKKRQLLQQYKKAKEYLLLGKTQEVNFKLRQPKKDKIFYFRINRQFRAFCFFRDEVYVVFDIDNHQD